MFIDMLYIYIACGYVLLSLVIYFVAFLLIKKTGILAKFSNIFDVLRDDSPYSTMRAALLYFQFMFVPAFLYVWAKISIHNWQIAAPELVGVLFLIIFFSKVVSKKLEQADALPIIGSVKSVGPVSGVPANAAPLEQR